MSIQNVNLNTTNSTTSASQSSSASTGSTSNSAFTDVQSAVKTSVSTRVLPLSYYTTQLEYMKRIEKNSTLKFNFELTLENMYDPRNNFLNFSYVPKSASPVVTNPPTPPVNTDPVTPPVNTDPVTPPVDTNPPTPPVNTDPVTPPVDTTPVTPPVNTDPVTPPVDTTPPTPPVNTDPVTPPVDTTPPTPPVNTDPVTPPVDTNPPTPPVNTDPPTSSDGGHHCDENESSNHHKGHHHNFNHKIKHEVRDGEKFVENKSDKITSTDNKNYSIGAVDALKFFTSMQLDNGKQTKHGNGSDFSTKVIEAEINKIEKKISNSKSDISGNKINNYKIELGMLNAILAANTDNNKVVTLDEMLNIMPDDKMHFSINS